MTKLEDRVFLREVLQLPNVIAQVRKELANVIRGARRQILSHTARTHKRVVHAQTRDALKNTEHVLTASKGDRHHRGCAQLVTTGADCHQVRTNTVQLHQQNADPVSALRNLVGNTE